MNARAIDHVNVYRNGDQWCYSAWVEGEFDSSDTLDADSEQEAAIETSRLFPGALIKRVDDTNE